MTLAESNAVLKAFLPQCPRARIVSKSASWFWRVLGWLHASWMHGFTTTLGYTIYVSPNWEAYPKQIQVNTILHEMIHIKQAMKYTRPLFLFLYVLCPLPVLLAWFRYSFEREAYLVNIRAGIHTVDGVVSLLSGSAYGWAWPFRESMRRWFTEQLKG